MARKRMLDPHIWEDPSFNRLSMEARLLFIGMVSNADDEGYLRGDAGSLKRLIFGFDEVTKSSMEEWLGEISHVKNVHFYEVDDETYVHFVKWNDYQKQREDRIQASVYPKCTNCQTYDGQVPAEVKLSKDKLVESKVSINIIGDSRPEFYSESITEDEKKVSRIRNTQLSNLLDKRAVKLGIEQKSPIGITKEWQERAFREMKYIGVELKKDDIGRVFKVYKEESEGKKHATSTGRVIQYLFDHPTTGGYDGKLKMFFKLVSHGFNASGD